MTWTDPDKLSAARLRDEGKTYQEIAEETGHTLDQVKKLFWRQRGDKTAAATGCDVAATEKGQCITVHSHTVRDLDGALAVAKVDRAIWEVERWVANKWDQGSKRKEGGLAALELWQIKVWLKRIVPKSIEEAAGPFLERMRKHSPRYQAFKPKRISDPHLCEIALYDHHFGKLAWAPESGEHYDLRIAERIYDKAGEELIRKVAGFPVEKFLLPVGQDFFHIDSSANTTTAGTPQDVDGRLAKIFHTGQMAVIRLVDLLLQIAPVELLWVPGNHDRTTSWYLAKTLEAWYLNAKHVTVNAAPSPRKYVEYGQTLLGFTHGDEEKHDRLPGLMAAEQREAWARTSCWEFHVGHRHAKKQMKYNALDTYDGVVVRTLESLAGTDAWHYSRGFVRPRRAAQALLYSRKDGFAGEFSSHISNEMYRGDS